MLTSCGGMLSDFLNAIPEEFHTAILKKHTAILLGSFFPFRLLSFVLLLTYYVHYSFLKLWLWSHLPHFTYLRGSQNLSHTKSSLFQRQKFLVFSLCSFCKMMFSGRSNAEGSTNTAVMHFILQLKRWSLWLTDHAEIVYSSDSTISLLASQLVME